MSYNCYFLVFVINWFRAISVICFLFFLHKLKGTMTTRDTRSLRLQQEMALGLRQKGHLGKCQECGHMGHAHLLCKQCEGQMDVLSEADDDNPDFMGFCFENYWICGFCKNVEIDINGEKKDCCSKCRKAGLTNSMHCPYFEENEELKDQKCLPLCAQVSVNRCNDCFNIANYFGQQFPRCINMASSIIILTREYDALVEIGYKINLDKKQLQKTKFLCEPTSLDLTPENLRSLIEHHHKMCLCSMCKWWIISNNKQGSI